MNTSTVTPFRQKTRLLTLWAFTIASLILLMFSRPHINEESTLDIVLDICGALLVLGGALGRLWSTLYIGGKKNNQLVTTGPYSMTRNPLYVFSIIAIFGIGLMFGSILFALTVLLIAVGIFTYTAKREARYLMHRFGAEYVAYARTTPLFWPRISKIQSPSEITVTIKSLKIPLRDALLFLLLIPIMELLEYLHFHEYILTFFIIP